jgi:hypothetical protein
MQVYAGADVEALGSTLHALLGPRTQVSNLVYVGVIFGIGAIGLVD